MTQQEKEKEARDRAEEIKDIFEVLIWLGREDELNVDPRSLEIVVGE
jgi:hypothetical protein